MRSPVARIIAAASDVASRIFPFPSSGAGVPGLGRPSTLSADLSAAIATRRAARLARPARTEAKRLAHARPKVEQLRSALTQHAQKLRDEAGAR